jgi:hypothetical protein
MDELVRIECSLESCFASRGSEVLGGVGPQALGGHEVVGDGVPERMGLGLDQTAHGKKTKAVVLAIGVDPLDALTQGINSLARFARHPFAPRLEAGSFSRLRRRLARLAGLMSSPSLGGGV